MGDLSSWAASLPAEWTAGCSDAVFTSTHAQYQSPGRFYHTWNHVVACVETLRNFPCGSGQRVFLALLFHDAIYVPGSRENEKRSAELAGTVLRQHSKIAEADIAEIQRFILATQDHRVSDAEKSTDLRATIDIDMSILGSPWEQYRAYVAGVHDEYCPAVTSENRFLVGRGAFLAGVLKSPSIFHTVEGATRWEQLARGNVSRELGELRARQGLLWRIASGVLRRFRPTVRTLVIVAGGFLAFWIGGFLMLTQGEDWEGIEAAIVTSESARKASGGDIRKVTPRFLGYQYGTVAENGHASFNARTDGAGGSKEFSIALKKRNGKWLVTDVETVD